MRSAAAEFFWTRGFDAKSVRDIATTAGASVGTVALAGDKATLFLEVMEENAFALVGGALERLSGEPVRTGPTLFALEGACGSAVEMAQWLRDLITAQTRTFERAGICAGMSS